VGTTKPGASRTLTVIRDGKEREIAVTLGQLPDKDPQRTGAEQRPDDGGPRLNVAVADCPPASTTRAGACWCNRSGRAPPPKRACGRATFCSA
jgi:hypothetical protein